MGTLLTIQMWPSHAVAHTDGVEAYWNKIVGENGVPIMDNLRKRTNDHHDKCMTAAEVEGIYLGVPNNDSAAAASERISVQSHSAGTGWDFVTAIKVKNDWERALGLPITGYDGSIFDAGTEDSQKRIKEGGEMSVWIDTYYPLLNTPVARTVTLMTDSPFHAKLREDVIEEDPFSANTDAVPAFHGYSISGDVTGKIIYAGYGRKADFDLLQSKGVDFTGKIAFVKYGSVFRGLKVKAAQEAGAIGCIIFTDPGDDGEVTEANGYVQYPDGPARQNSSIQRGSVQFVSQPSTHPPHSIFVPM
jgi:N-acetylated-alpha-linked acidic dipeptidase